MKRYSNLVIVALMIGFSSAAQAALLVDFESGYSAGALSGQNGWTYGGGGSDIFVASSTAGKDPSWGAYAFGGGTAENGWWTTSKIGHDVSTNSGDTVVLEADLNPTTSNGGAQIGLFDFAGSYLYTELDTTTAGVNNYRFVGYDGSGLVFANYLGAAISAQWYHIKLTWNVGTDARMEIRDAANTVVYDQTYAYTSTPTLSGIRITNQYAGGSAFDNISVNVPEPATLAVLALGAVVSLIRRRR